MIGQVTAEDGIIGQESDPSVDQNISRPKFIRQLSFNLPDVGIVYLSDFGWNFIWALQKNDIFATLLHLRPVVAYRKDFVFDIAMAVRYQ